MLSPTNLRTKVLIPNCISRTALQYLRSPSNPERTNVHAVEAIRLGTKSWIGLPGKYQGGALIVWFSRWCKGPDVSVDVTTVPCCSCCQNSIETEGNVQKYFFLFDKTLIPRPVYPENDGAQKSEKITCVPGQMIKRAYYSCLDPSSLSLFEVSCPLSTKLTARPK